MWAPIIVIQAIVGFRIDHYESRVYCQNSVGNKLLMFLYLFVAYGL